MRTLEPAILRWARERAGLSGAELAARLGVGPERVAEWERSGRISVAQADRLAQRTHTPVGYLYLREPPEEELPIPDFRASMARRPSPNLLDTVYLMSRRQAWMREELLEDGADPLALVGRCDTATSASDTAAVMREHLDLTPDWAARRRSWTDALRYLRERAEERGVLVVFNAVAGNNTHRRLNRDEFQGFALIDEYAPLVFVNGADFKAAQMFTLAHELAHLFVGAAGVSGLDVGQGTRHDTERFCNSAAAELLVPARELTAAWRPGAGTEALEAAARRFKVSVLVIAWRAVDLRLIERKQVRGFYEAYRQQAARRTDERSGGNFWNSQRVRIGRRFGAAVRRAVKEGRLSYREAYALTGLRGDAFETFVQSMEPAK